MSTLTEGTPGGDKTVGDNSQAASQSMGERWEELGTESRRTWIFVGLAFGCLVATGLYELTTKTEEIKEYGRVGEEFYPEFTDPTLATSLSVKVIDADELKPLEFSVKQADNGRWVIPSHHNYQADAADRLANTASSVIGIKRGAMVTRWSSDHTRYGVVDPETDTVGIDEIEGIGKRLTLGNGEGELASFIIGKQVDGETDQYYVRHPGEDETYIATLEIDLSTKFTDWVDTDLLGINNTDIRRLQLNDYSFEERGTSLAVTRTEVSTLSRDTSGDDWKMDGLDEVTQEVNTDSMGDTVNAIADLKLAGVRPKQPGLTADLQLDRAALKSQRDLDRMQSDLLSRGFLLQPSKSNPETLTLISREGEMSVGTEDGLVYQLHFGRVFTGSDEELEIGLASSDDEDDEQTEDEGADEDEAGEDADEDSDDSEEVPSGKPGRYVFVRVDVDPSLFGDEPMPVKPEMSQELKDAEEKAKADAEKPEDSGDSDESESADDDATSEDGSSDEDSDESEDEDSAEEDAKKAEEEKLQQLRDEYAAGMKKFEDDAKALVDYREKVDAATKKAEDLNRRFAQWYYVIPGDSYDKLALSRQDLVQAKESEEGEGDNQDAVGPSLSLPGLGGPESRPLVPDQLKSATGEPAEEPASEPTDLNEPETNEAEMKEPEATEPESTEPESTEPESTEPESTEPESTEPEATEPESPDPEATEPDPEPSEEPQSSEDE